VENLPGSVVARRRRGPLGLFFEWTFVLFNLLMFYLLIDYWRFLYEKSANYGSIGTAIGGAMGSGTLLAIWLVIGAVLLESV
jgi:hypothetical protein